MIKLPSLGDKVSVWMDAPPAAVWDLVSDVTRIGEFSPETFEARWTRGSTGPEVGAYFKGHVKRNGVGPTYWTLCKVTQCVPEKVFEFAVGTDALWAALLAPQQERAVRPVEGDPAAGWLPRVQLRRLDPFAGLAVAAAGLDVYNNEPRVDPALLALENVVLLPHLGSATVGTRDAMGFKVLDGLDAVLAGRKPPNLVP